MKKDRASHKATLTKSTGALFSTFTANKKAQDEIDGQLTAATHVTESKTKQELSTAKDEFATKIAGLTSTVEKNKANTHTTN